MKQTIKIAILFVAIVSQSSVWAQQDTSIVDDELQSIIAFVYQLPPLEELLELANEQSSLLKSREALVQVKQSELSRIKNDWLDILTFKGNMGYGNGLIDVNQNNMSDVVVTNTNSLRFNIGVSVNLSPSYWVERKFEIKTRKAHLAYEEAMVEQSKDVVSEAVTGAYVTLEFYRDVFLQANAGYESNRSTLKLAEKKFLEGEVDISTYNEIQLKSIKLKVEIEGYKRNMKKAYYDLNRLVNWL